MINTLCYCILRYIQKMIQDLELAKKETWEEKERLSSKYEEERTKNLANKVSTMVELVYKF